MNLIGDVNRFYQENKISAVGFNCGHLSSCNPQNNQGFVKATEAYIGREYERGAASNGGVPRLLFLSLDPGQENQDESGRSIEGQRKYVKDHPDLGPKNRHWFRTHKMAVDLLGQFKSGLTEETVNSYFAHTRSAKCCMNKSGNRQADWQLFKNCREFIPGELNALRPDILVTQGDMAMEAIEKGANNVIERIGEQKEGGFAYLKLSHGSVLWIHTYHPSSYGNHFSHYNGSIEKWKREVGKLMKQRRE